jgi:hypothetical protein
MIAAIVPGFQGLVKVLRTLPMPTTVDQHHSIMDAAN